MLAFMSFPKALRTQIHSTNPQERLDAEIKRCTDVVGIFPNDASITRVVGALLLEHNGGWSPQRRYVQLEGLQNLSENQAARLSAVVSRARVQTSSHTTSRDAIRQPGRPAQWLGPQTPIRNTFAPKNYIRSPTSTHYSVPSSDSSIKRKSLKNSNIIS